MTISSKRKIFIAIDDTSPNQVIDYACKSFLLPTDDIYLINCRYTVEDHLGSTLFLDPHIINYQEQLSREESHKLLADAVHLLHQRKFKAHGLAIKGDPRTEIVRKAEEMNPDIVIVGSRRLGLIDQYRLGSVSNFLVNYLQVPILVVPYL